MLSRRLFLNGALGAGAVLASVPAPVAIAQTAQPQRKRVIVDFQVHIWQGNTPEHPWVPGSTAQMPEPFTIEKLIAAMDEAGVDRAVIVPPSWVGDRIDYALEAAKRYPQRLGVMGRLPLKTPQSPDELARWKAQPGMLGIRLTFLGRQPAC